MSYVKDDDGWNNHIWVNQEKIVEMVSQQWHDINNLYFAGKYDIRETLSKDDLHKFLWVAYKFCIATHYDAADIKIGSVLRGPDSLHITKYKTSYAGLCRSFGPPQENGSYTITISYRYYQDWGNIQILETLLHEIGHLTYWNHDDEFWKEGERIGYGLEPKGVKPRPAKFRQYCGQPGCDWERFSCSRPSKYVICPYCFPVGDDKPEPNFDTWLALPSVEKVWTIIEKYQGPEYLIY